MINTYYSPAKTGYRLGVCHCWFHSYWLIQAVCHAKKPRITKWKILGRSRWILFGRFREEVENVSANQRPWRPSCFSDRPEKHKLSKRRIKSCFLASFVQFNSLIDLNIIYFNFAMKKDLLVSVRSRKCLSQSEARAAILFYQSARNKTHKIGRGHWDLASCNNSRKSKSNATKVELVLHQDKYLYKNFK